MIVCIIKQPLAVIATDSARIKSYDMSNFEESVYVYDAKKLHVSHNVVIAGGGNAQVLASLRRRVTEESVVAGGVEQMLKRAPTLLNRAARAWETEIKFKFPKADIETVRKARHTFAMILGYSVRKKRLLCGAMADNPAMNSLAPENGFLVQGGTPVVKRQIENDLKAMLFGPERISPEMDSLCEACRSLLSKAAELENEAAGRQVMGGRIRVKAVNGSGKPEEILEPVVTL